jgi:hypothetical protein
MEQRSSVTCRALRVSRQSRLIGGTTSSAWDFMAGIFPGLHVVKPGNNVEQPSE